MDTDVTVVGAGPTGLTAAGELARRGWRVRVLDAAATPFPGSRGKGIQPRTLEVLDPLGVTDRMVSVGRFRMPIRSYAPDGTWTEHLMHGEPEPTPDRPWVGSLLIPQWRTEQVLRDRLGELGVTVEQDARVSDVTQDGDGVTAVLEDGRTVGSRYLVAADGGSSVVRHRLGVSFLGETQDEIRMLLADIEVDGLDRDHWHQFQRPGVGFVALCPLPATPTWALQFAPSDPTARPDEETLRAAVDGLLPRVRLRRIGWSSTWRLNVRMVDRYRVGRVFLAGDAAHVHSPAGGQGANTGIQDAVNLGWKLAAVLGGADEALLDTYEAERLPVAADVLGLSSELTRHAFAARPPALAKRSLQLDISYRTDPDAPGLQPGDRAHDAPLGSSTLFLRRREAEWVLLGDPEHPGATDVPDGVLVLPAPESYDLTPGERMLVRPDGHVGWRGTGPLPQLNGIASLGQVAPSAGSAVGSSR